MNNIFSLQITPYDPYPWAQKKGFTAWPQHKNPIEKSQPSFSANPNNKLKKSPELIRQTQKLKELKQKLITSSSNGLQLNTIA